MNTLPVGTIVQDMWAFYPDDSKPKYEKQEDGKWFGVHERWIRYSIPEKEIGKGKRYEIVSQPRTNTDKNLKLAEAIYKALNEKGAELGNFSLFIIRSAIEDFKKQTNI
jgi:hypothetical protein